MKILALIITGSLAVSTAALAQQSTVRGEASVESQTAVSATRRGASVESEAGARGGLTAERGTNGEAAADLEGASQINATLERSVDARRARPGDEVTAKTSEDFVTQGGVTIPRGTRLVGRVTEAQAHAGGKGSAPSEAGSRLGIVFEKAMLKDGRELPLNATIQALAATRSDVEGRLGSANEGGALRGSSGGAGSLGGVASAGGGAAGGLAGGAGSVIGGVTRTPGTGAVGAAVSGAAGAAARGGVLGSSTGAVGGLSSSGRLLAGSRGVFGLRDLDIAATAADGARGTLITSASRNVRLDGGTQLLLVGSVMR